MQYPKSLIEKNIPENSTDIYPEQADLSTIHQVLSPTHKHTQKRGTGTTNQQNAMTNTQLKT